MNTEHLNFILLNSHPSVNPPAGQVFVYVLSSDKHVYKKDSSGIVIDMTPSIWQLNGSNAYYNSGNIGINQNNPQQKLHVGGNSYLSLISIGRSGNHYDEIGYNIGYTNSDNTYTYRLSDYACSIRMGQGGGMYFRSAPSGTAGQPLTLTEIMVLNTSGLQVYGSVQSKFKLLSSDPTPTDIPDGYSLLVKNTATGILSLWANNNGILKKIDLT